MERKSYEHESKPSDLPPITKDYEYN